MGCSVSTYSVPALDGNVMPTLWTGNNSGTPAADESVTYRPDIVYQILNSDGGPFKTRTDTHVVQTSTFAYMSELFFEQPVELTEIVAHAQDMASGDEWQLSLIANNDGNDVNIGTPITSDGRHSWKLERRNVQRVMLHIAWTATSTAARVAPSLTRIELYGKSMTVE